MKTKYILLIMLCGLALPFLSYSQSCTGSAGAANNINDIQYNAGTCTFGGTDNWIYDGNVVLTAGNYVMGNTNQLRLDGESDGNWIITRNTGGGEYVTSNALILDYAAGTGEGLILENSNSNVNFEILGSTGAITFDKAYTFPTSDGSENQVLTTDGSGSLSWQSAGCTPWCTIGNAATAYGANFIGTTDEQCLMFKVDNTEAGFIEDGSCTGSTALGSQALLNNTGSSNAAFGLNALGGNTSGSDNAAFGYGALLHNSTGSYNVAIGAAAGLSAYGTSGGEGNDNIAIGYETLAMNQADSNIAIGIWALRHNTFANQNIAIGIMALNSQSYDNDEATFPTDNIAIGYQALYSNNPDADNPTGGAVNIALGYQAAYGNTWGEQNISIGYQAGYTLEQGTGCVYLGYQAGYNDNSEGDNTFIGYQAGITNVGYDAAYNNTCLGSGADVGSDDLYNATSIGHNAIAPENNTMELGDCYVVFTGINGGAYNSDLALVIGSPDYCFTANGNGAYCTTGGVWSVPSSIEYKDNLTPLNGKDVLKKIDTLTVEGWKYKGTNEYHIGPFAGQFYKLFNTGLDSLHIGLIDPIGVAFIGIQQLCKNQNSTDSTIAQQQKQLDSLAKQNSNPPQIAVQAAQIANQQHQIDSLTKQNSGQQAQLATQQSEIDQLNTMVSKLDVALSECCTNYQSTTGSVSQPSTTNQLPYLNQNVPNPFSQNTTISCYVPTTAQNASIVIFNLNGQMLKSFTIPTTGFNQVVVTGGTLPAGVYLYTLYVNEQKVDTKQMTLTH